MIICAFSVPPLASPLWLFHGIISFIVVGILLNHYSANATPGHKRWSLPHGDKYILGVRKADITGYLLYITTAIPILLKISGMVANLISQPSCSDRHDGLCGTYANRHWPPAAYLFPCLLGCLGIQYYLSNGPYSLRSH